MRHWLGLADESPVELAKLVETALRIKSGADRDTQRILHGRVLVMLFFNSSLRTRTSFEAAMLRAGGHAICLNVGSDTWNIEYRDGAIMNGAAAEHVREAAPVLSRYGDLLAVRSFAEMKSPTADAEERVIRAFARHATVPVLNMESAWEHPCQGLADWLTIREKLGDPRGKRFTLTWAPHIKLLPLAVSHSAVLAAAAAGMHVTIAHPPGYNLGENILERARAFCRSAGTNLDLTHDQAAATRSADIVYAKSWGAPLLYGDASAQSAEFNRYADWQVRAAHLGQHTRLMHCLPTRRNVELADDALDDPRCIVVDQAENRLWAQTAILCKCVAKQPEQTSVR